MDTRNTKKIGMIPFFIPHMGCPQMCIFCNQPNISGQEKPVDTSSIYDTIVDYIGLNRLNKYWEVAFYGGSFTAISRDWQKKFLEPASRAYKEGLIDSIRCSTRPDAIDENVLDFLWNHGVRTIELGVQSMCDSILEEAKRGHTAQDVQEASRLIKKHGFTLGIQLLPGLPGETMSTLLSTMVSVKTIKPHFVRIYPVLVIEQTELGERFLQGLYEPLSVEQAIRYCSMMKTYFEKYEIDVIRTGLQATEEFDEGIGILGGPYAPAFGEMVVNHQYQQKIDRILWNHVEEFAEPIESVSIEYKRPLTSKVRGLKNKNVLYYLNRSNDQSDFLYHSLFSWHESTNQSLPVEYIQLTINSQWKYLV